MSSEKVIRKEAFYPYHPERVWKALTNPKALAEWLMPNNFRAEKGARFNFHVDPMPGFSGVTECEVLEINPPRRMVWSWTLVPKKAGKARPEPMTIEWTLESEGDGTRLTLVHRGAERIAWIHRVQMAFGWGTMVRRWMPQIIAKIDEKTGEFPGGVRPVKKRGYGVKTVPDGYAV